MSDLRGYGDSDKPTGEAGHAASSFRAMAADQLPLMDELGHATFAIASHDRGGRTTHRLCLDAPARVRRAAVLDIAPTLTMFERTDMAFAMAYFHWFLWAQPAPLPKRLIGADSSYHLRAAMLGWDGASPFDTRFFDPACGAEYERINADPATIHGLCEDYRAAATIDLNHHRADRAAGRRIACPLLVLWGERNRMWRPYDMLAVWRAEASGPVEGAPIVSGHYIAEENPEATAAMLETFFTQGGV